MRKGNFSWSLTFLLFLSTLVAGVTKDKEKPPENIDSPKNENLLLIQKMTWLSAGPLVNRQKDNSLFNGFIEKKMRSGVDYYGFMQRWKTEPGDTATGSGTDSVHISESIDWQSVFDDPISSARK